MERSCRSYLFKVNKTIVLNRLLYLKLAILLLSCENEPIGVSNNSQYSVSRYTSTIDNDLSFTVLDDSLRFDSPLVYSGYIDLDSGGIIVDSSIMIIDFSNNLCDIEDSTSVLSIDILFNSTSILSDTLLGEIYIDKDLLNIFFHNKKFDPTFNIYEYLNDSDKQEIIDYTINGSKLEIDLMDPNFNMFNQICSQNNDLNYSLSLEYFAENSEKSNFLEFHSSKSYNNSLKPSIRYSYLKEDTLFNNRFLITNESIQGDEILGKLYYSFPLNNDQRDSLYFVDINLSDNIIEGGLNYSDIDSFSPIISNEKINSDLVLANINIDFNDLVDQNDTIIVRFENIKIYKYSLDPNGDNYNQDSNPDGTENNNVYDEGELWDDLGIDVCPDSLEIIGGGCASTIADSDYSNGTEGNGILDWEDLDGNGVWTDSSEGEKWFDCGIDQVCNDNDDSDNYMDDPNGDNYNQDSNPDGSEGNGVYDLGEPFFDIGIDGIEFSDDYGENNYTFQPGEPFLDTGADGSFDYDESGYNIIGTENNKNYDFGEQFEDCGIDSTCDDGDSTDDYNGDPNNDNYNSLSNPNGQESNNVYDNGELFYDYGSDGLSNKQEIYSISDNVYNLNNIQIEFTIDNMQDFVYSEALDSTGIRVSDLSGSLDSGLNIEVSLFSETEVSLIEFEMTHNPIKVPSMVEKTEYSLSYLEDNTLHNRFYDFFDRYSIDIQSDTIKSSLFQSAAFGAKSILSFSDFNLFPINNSQDILDASTLVLPISKQSSLSDDGLWIFPKSLNSNKFLDPYFLNSNDSLVQINISSALKEYVLLDSSDFYEPFVIELYTPGIKNNFSYIFYDDNNKPNLQLYISE